MHYIFELQCPRCRAERQAVGEKENLPPRMFCGDDLSEFTIVRVHVIAGQSGVDMLQYINDQRSKDHDDVNP